MARPTQRPAFLGNTAITGVGYTELTKRSGRSVLDLATRGVPRARSPTPACAGRGRRHRQLHGDARLGADPGRGHDARPAALRFSLDIDLGGQAPCHLVTQAAAGRHHRPGRATSSCSAPSTAAPGPRVGTMQFPGWAPSSATRSATTPTSCTSRMWARRFLHETGQDAKRPRRRRVAQRAYAEAQRAGVSPRAARPRGYLAAPYRRRALPAADCTVEVDGACAVLVTSARRGPRPRAIRRRSSPPGLPAGARPGLDIGDSPLAGTTTPATTPASSRDDLFGAGRARPGRRRLRRDLRLLHEHRADGAGGPRPRRARRGRRAGPLGRDGADGSLPVNTHGGLLAEGYLHGMNTVAEAALQVQGRAGDRRRARRDLRVTSGALTTARRWCWRPTADRLLARSTPPSSGCARRRHAARLGVRRVRSSLASATRHLPAVRCPVRPDRQRAGPSDRLALLLDRDPPGRRSHAVETPYTVGLVELDGRVLYGRIIGVDHDDLRDALRLRVDVTTIGEQPIWTFGPE